MRSWRRDLVPLVLAAVALAGCDGGPFGGGGSGEPNATDAAFVRAMIAHERASGSMAQIGSRKALRWELRRIARTRLDRHGRYMPALDAFRAELRALRVSPAGAAIHTEPPRFDPRGLRVAVSIDHEFLVRMVEQHQFAMAMAALERDHGADGRIKLLAHEIYEASRRDLASLRRWLRTWYGDDTHRGVPPAPSPGGGGGPAPEV